MLWLSLAKGMKQVQLKWLRQLQIYAFTEALKKRADLF